MTSEEEDLDGFFFKIKQLLERKSGLYWHTKLFDRYMEQNINPWGLRVQVFPKVRDPTPEFQTKWEKVLTKCSEGLMDLLKEHHQNELREIQSELVALDIKSTKLKSNKGYDTRKRELGDYMERFNRNLIQNKLKKFEKYLRAFQLGRTYRWQQNYVGNRPRSRFTRTEAPLIDSLVPLGVRPMGPTPMLSLFGVMQHMKHSHNTTPRGLVKK